MRLFFYILFSLFAIQSFSQEIVLEYADYMQQVKMHHPVARQANISLELGDAYLTKTRGAFDPKIDGNANQKYFKDQQYYSLLNAGLKIPTWYGVSFQTGYELTSGQYLNPERTLPDEGLWYAGVNVSVGRGLIIDQRRAEFKKAKIFQESSLQNKRMILNELYLQSSMAYWDWFKAYNKMLVYQEAVQNALERFEGVKISAIAGDKPFMDTLEASIQLQNRVFNYLNAELEYQNASDLLEIYLWESGYIPVELDSNTIPAAQNQVSINAIDPEIAMMVDSIANFHPELLNAQYKIDQQKIDLKLSRENLKPTLNFKYNALMEPLNGDAGSIYSLSNYQWGAEFSYPLFIRKERGELKINKLKVENLEQELFFKTEQIQFKIKYALNSWSTTYKQILIWQKTTNDYLRLLENEKVLFEIGESSLFMINSREKAYINARLLLIETIANNKKEELKTKYAIGVLHQDF